MPLLEPDLIPKDHGDLVAGWLTKALDERVRGPLDVTPIATTSFSHVARLQGASGSWIVKWSRVDRAHPELERGHEILFYDRVARSLPSESLAPAVAWAHEPSRAAIMVIFEDLPGYARQPPSHLPPPLPVGEMMVDTLASIHAARWSNPPLALLGLALPDSEEIEARVVAAADRVTRLTSAHGHALGAHTTRILLQVIDQMPRILLRLQDPTAMSVVHDDVHVGNFLLPHHQGTARLLDWQTWIPDMATRDLAHMIAYFWFPAARNDLELPLLRRYHDALQSRSIDYDWEMLWHDYRISVIRKVLHAVWEWDMGAAEWKWYSHLMRTVMAYEDLSCHEV